MRLEAFITDLLYEHDCVVIPGFGGLVANYRSARLNRRTHMIMPPSKHIGFNRNLVSNDGLLIHHVSATMGIAYKDAMTRVEECILTYQQSLLNEGRLLWDKIGVFFRDKSGHIQFIPEEQENFLLSSFGLAPVQLKFIGEISSTEETPVIPIAPAAHKTPAWKIAAAIAIPLLVGGTLLLRNQLLHSDQFNFASLNPFATERIESGYQPRSPKSTADYSEIDITAPDPGLIPVPSVVPPAEPTVIKPAVPRQEPKKTATPPNLKGKYCVIGGAFKVKSNASNYLKKLRAEGFDAQLAGTKDGLTLVAYGVYDTQAEAVNAIRNIRAADNVNAWVKHN